jgi:hypothetical protein
MNVNDVAAGQLAMKVRVQGVREFRFRLWCARNLIVLAGKIAPILSVEFDYKRSDA